MTSAVTDEKGSPLTFTFETENEERDGNIEKNTSRRNTEEKRKKTGLRNPHVNSLKVIRAWQTGEPEKKLH